MEKCKGSNKFCDQDVFFCLTVILKIQKNVTQSRVMEFAQEIVDNRFPISQLEIDDAWATHYGDLVFDPVKFPDPKV